MLYSQSLVRISSTYGHRRSSSNTHLTKRSIWHGFESVHRVMSTWVHLAHTISRRRYTSISITQQAHSDVQREPDGQLCGIRTVHNPVNLRGQLCVRLRHVGYASIGVVSRCAFEAFHRETSRRCKLFTRSSIFASRWRRLLRWATSNLVRERCRSHLCWA